MLSSVHCSRDSCLRLLDLSLAYRWPAVTAAALNAVRCNFSPTLPGLQQLPQSLLLSVLQDDSLEVNTGPAVPAATRCRSASPTSTGHPLPLPLVLSNLWGEAEGHDAMTWGAS